jgi:hypothetical protein
MTPYLDTNYLAGLLPAATRPDTPGRNARPSAPAPPAMTPGTDPIAHSDHHQEE